MESSHKKMTSAGAVFAFAALLAWNAAAISHRPVVREKAAETEKIVCWYTGEENTAFFEKCADDFQKETGIAVTLEQQQSLDYFSGIYQAVKEETEQPDVYLLKADSLSQAYFSQLLEKNRYAEEYQENYAKNAIAASEYNGTMYGYPLYMNTCVFAYRTDYFEETPKSIQDMIDYSVEHDPGEGVEKLFEWDLSDGFFNFAFFGNAVRFSEEKECLSYSYDDAAYEADQNFFGNLTATIELDENSVTSENVVGDFVRGKTVAILLNSDDMGRISNVNYNITALPALNDELDMTAAAETGLLCVNAMSLKKEEAAQFAEYVTTKKEGILGEMTGHVPVQKSAVTGENQKTAFDQYESAVLKPDALDTTDFWVKFQNAALKIWNDAE